LAAGTDVSQKQVEAGWTLKEMCSLMYALGKLIKQKKTDCTSALADVMDLFIETMLASGEVFRSDSQQICMMFSSISKTNYRPSPIFVSALTRFMMHCLDCGMTTFTTRTDALS
jgi:hypothetical protein